MNLISQWMDGPAGGVVNIHPPLPNYMPLAPQMRHAPFRYTASSGHGWGPPAVLSTRSVFLLGDCATVSNPTGTSERALGHQVPWHWPEVTPPHLGVPGGGAPVVVDTPNLPLQSALSCSALSACQVGRDNWRA